MGLRGIRAIGYVTFATLSACAGKGAPGTAEAPSDASAKGASKENAEIDLAGLLAREATGLSTQHVTGDQGAWSADVLGSGAAQGEVKEGSIVVEVPIGAEDTMTCQTFTEAVDAGGTLHSVLASAAESVKFVSLAATGVKVVGRAPAVFLEGEYRADTADGKAAGLYKVAFYANEELSLLCRHDELGYKKTFARAAESFFKSFTRKGVTEQKPLWLDVSKTSVDGKDLSFSVTRVLPGDAKGELHYENLETSFSASAENLKLEDTVSSINLDARGKLKNGVWVVAQGGELRLKITVSAEKDKLSYEGTVAGKPVKGELSQANFATVLDPAIMLKKQLKSGKPFKQTLHEYHPSLNPTGLVAVTYSHDAGQEARVVDVSVGELKATVKVDPSGMPESGFMPAGDKKLVISREYVEGTL